MKHMQTKLILSLGLAALVITAHPAIGAQCESYPGATCTPVPGYAGLVKYSKPRPDQRPYWQQIVGVDRPPFARSVALLVGVASYDKLTKLDFVYNDIREMRRFLLDDDQFNDVYVALDRDVNAAGLQGIMVNLFSEKLLGSEDRFLFYYSGHGSPQGDGKGHLLLAGADAKAYTPAWDIPVSEITGWSRRLKAKHALFVLDGCGLGLGLVAKSPSLIQMLSSDGSRIAYAATRGAENSYGTKDQKYSIFTQELLRSLRSRDTDPNGKGYVTIQMAAAHMQPALATALGVSAASRDWKPLQPETLDPQRSGTFIFLRGQPSGAVTPPGPGPGVAMSPGPSPSVAMGNVTLPVQVIGTPRLNYAGRTACVHAAGQPYCWGNKFRERDLSDPNVQRLETPVPLKTFQLDDDGACGVGTDRRLYCIGSNTWNTIPGPASTLLTRVSQDEWISFARGELQSCGQKINGDVVCRGDLYEPIATSNFPRQMKQPKERKVEGLPAGEVHDYRFSILNVLFLMDDGSVFVSDWGPEPADRASLSARPLFEGHVFASIHVGRRGPFWTLCAAKASGVALCRSGSAQGFQFEFGNTRLGSLAYQGALIVSADGKKVGASRFTDVLQLDDSEYLSVEQLGFSAENAVVDIALTDTDCTLVLAQSGAVRAFVFDATPAKPGDRPARYELRPLNPTGDGCVGPPTTTPWVK